MSLTIAIIPQQKYRWAQGIALLRGRGTTLTDSNAWCASGKRRFCVFVENNFWAVCSMEFEDTQTAAYLLRVSFNIVRAVHFMRPIPTWTSFQVRRCDSQRYWKDLGVPDEWHNFAQVVELTWPIMQAGTKPRKKNFQEYLSYVIDVTVTSPLVDTYVRLEDPCNWYAATEAWQIWCKLQRHSVYFQCKGIWDIGRDESGSQAPWPRGYFLLWPSMGSSVVQSATVCFASYSKSHWWSRVWWQSRV